MKIEARTGGADEGKLSSRIALAGGSVERASEELRQVAAAIQAAAAEAREADVRVQELERRVEELTERLAALGDAPLTVIADRERAALQGAVAAEVRRPLASILGITLALKHHDPDSSEGSDMVKQLAANARKLDRLVTQLLELDRLLLGTLSPARRRTDLAALVRRVTDESPDLANRKVVVETERAAVGIDPGLTEQIVGSLLATAGSRTAPGNHVWVKVSSDASGAVIAVEDAGPEVPAAVRDAMAAPAQDAQQDAMRPKGAAALWLVARLAAVQGGRAWVEERPDGGASFRVFLPDVMEATDGAASTGGGAAVPDGAGHFRALEDPVAIDDGAIAI